MNIPIWSGTSTYISGSGQCPFGFYDTDPAFALDADRIAKWCAIRLGFPIVNVELQSGSFYAAFEEAVTQYGNEIYQYKIMDNYLSMEGNSTGSSFNDIVVTPTLGTVIRISKMYGSEATSGGTVDYHRTSIYVSASRQDYDLNKWALENGISGSIEIKRIFNDSPSAMQRYFDPYAGVGTGPQAMFEAFGFGNMSPGISFMMMPVNMDVLKVQAIEFNDQIRRSAYTFDLINNKLRLFPIPTEDQNVFFEYILVSERDDVTNNNTKGQTNLISNVSKVPYENPVYHEINSVGRQWVFQYTLALSKEMLGYIRKKYQSIPIPGADVMLNGDQLVADAQKEKTDLIQRLRDNLEQTSRKSQLERQVSEAQSINQQLNNVPLPIWIM